MSNQISMRTETNKSNKTGSICNPMLNFIIIGLILDLDKKKIFFLGFRKKVSN